MWAPEAEKEKEEVNANGEKGEDRRQEPVEDCEWLATTGKSDEQKPSFADILKKKKNFTEDTASAAEDIETRGGEVKKPEDEQKAGPSAEAEGNPKTKTEPGEAEPKAEAKVDLESETEKAAKNTKEGEMEKKKEEEGEAASKEVKPIKEKEKRKEKKQDTGDLGRKGFEANKEEEKKHVVETKTQPGVEAGAGAEAEAKADPETLTEKEADNTKEGEKEKKKEEESASKEDNPVREQDKKKVVENKKSEWTRVAKKVKPERRKEPKTSRVAVKQVAVTREGSRKMVDAVPKKEEKMDNKPRRRRVVNWKPQVCYTRHMKLSEWLMLKGDTWTAWDYICSQDEMSPGPKLVKVDQRGRTEWFIELQAMGPSDPTINELVGKNKEDQRPGNYDDDDEAGQEKKRVALTKVKEVIIMLMRIWKLWNVGM